MTSRLPFNFFDILRQKMLLNPKGSPSSVFFGIVRLFLEKFLMSSNPSQIFSALRLRNFFDVFKGPSSIFRSFTTMDVQKIQRAPSYHFRHYETVFLRFAQHAITEFCFFLTPAFFHATFPLCFFRDPSHFFY